MLAFKQILCPIDFSQPSFRALTDALELIKRFGGKLTVLHVVPPVPLVELPPGTGTVAFDVKKYESELISTYDQTLRDTVKERIGSDVPIEYHVALGDAAAQIVSYAEAKKIDAKVLPASRLFPDMLPLTSQVRIACDAAKYGVARIAGD